MFNKSNQFHNRRNSDRPRYQSKRKYKIKQDPEPPKPCVVRYLPEDVLMDYWPDEKQLTVLPFGSYYEFSSKVMAQKAIWHTVQASGIPGSHVNYKIEEL